MRKKLLPKLVEKLNSEVTVDLNKWKDTLTLSQVLDIQHCCITIGVNDWQRPMGLWIGRMAAERKNFLDPSSWIEILRQQLMQPWSYRNKRAYVIKPALREIVKGVSESSFDRRKQNRVLQSLYHLTLDTPSQCALGFEVSSDLDLESLRNMGKVVVWLKKVGRLEGSTKKNSPDASRCRVSDLQAQIKEAIEVVAVGKQIKLESSISNTNYVVDILLSRISTS